MKPKIKQKQSSLNVIKLVKAHSSEGLPLKSFRLSTGRFNFKDPELLLLHIQSIQTIYLNLSKHERHNGNISDNLEYTVFKITHFS